MKSSFLTLSFILSMVLLSVGCSKDTPPTASGQAEQPAVLAASAPVEGGHAPANVKPGSHDDWCQEHQVPESMCTRCNPSLVAAFKATNDWCGEHGLPESQCLKCNPELKIVRPPKEQ